MPDNKPDCITELEKEIRQFTHEEYELALLFAKAVKNDDKAMQELLWAVARGDVERSAVI